MMLVLQLLCDLFPFPIIIEVAIMPGQYSTKEVEWHVQ